MGRDGKRREGAGAEAGGGRVLIRTLPYSFDH